MRRLALASVVGLAIVLGTFSAPALAQRGATERLTLVVEVIDRDPTPTIPCGVIGAQPRDVTARVIAVEAGAFARETILLRWPMCSLGEVEPGARFRIRIRRWSATPDVAESRYRVRWSEPAAAP